MTGSSVRGLLVAVGKSAQSIPGLRIRTVRKRSATESSCLSAVPGHWTGSAFDPKRKLNYTVDLQLDGDRLMTRDCLADSAFCISAEWRRAGSTAGGSSANRGEYDGSA